MGWECGCGNIVFVILTTKIGQPRRQGSETRAPRLSAMSHHKILRVLFIQWQSVRKYLYNLIRHMIGAGPVFFSRQTQTRTVLSYFYFPPPPSMYIYFIYFYVCIHIYIIKCKCVYVNLLRTYINLLSTYYVYMYTNITYTPIYTYIYSNI